MGTDDVVTSGSGEGRHVECGVDAFPSTTDEAFSRERTTVLVHGGNPD